MDFLNFLGGLGAFNRNPDQRFGDGYDPTSGAMSVAGSPASEPLGGVDLNASLAQNALTPHPQRQDNGSGLLGKVFGQGAGGTIRNVLGALADALVMNAGGQPIYGPKMQRKKMGSALANYLGNSDAGLADIFQQDPETGLALYKMTHPAQAEPTASQRDFSYYSGLQGPARQAYEKFLQLTHPGMMSPITMGPNDTLEMPGQEGGQAQGEVTATGPNGEKVRYNPQSGQWEPLQGGPTASPSGGFLGR